MKTDTQATTTRSNIPDIDLSIIIVNWNSVEYLRSCLKSILQYTKGIRYEIIVIDNASFDGSEALVENEFPSVIFHQSTKNLGFAGANNHCSHISKGRVLLFLNPDTELTGSTINALYSSLESLPDCGVAGPRLLNSDMSLQTSSILAFPTLLNQIFDSDFLKKKRLWANIFGIKPYFTGNDNPQIVNAVSGASLMIKRDIFKKVGGFSTNYFMYSEDIDLCYKVKKSGYVSYYINEATIIHHGGGSSQKQPFKHFNTVLMKESTFRFIHKTRGIIHAELYRLVMLITSTVRIVLISSMLFCALLMGRKTSLRSSLNKWKTIFKWSIGLEKWAKELH